jgi:polysaccharide pyruvyl transferase WcaK-like protein
MKMVVIPVTKMIKKIRPEIPQNNQQTSEINLNQSQVQPAPDISKYIKNPIQFVSKIPAAKYQIPELAFSDEEAMACAESINGILQAFVPDQNAMDPKTASVLSLGMVVGYISFL